MSDQMKAAGKSGGKIKHRKYLAYLASIREEEALARQLGTVFLPKSVEAIRREFEQEHGSILLTSKNFFYYANNAFKSCK